MRFKQKKRLKEKNEIKEINGDKRRLKEKED